MRTVAAGIGLCWILLLSTQASPACAQTRPGPEGQRPEPGMAAWQVAITFDDLPMTGNGDCTADGIVALHDGLLEALDRHHVVATGFVIPGTRCQADGPASASAIAARWIEAGHSIGNHGFSHPDFNTTPVARYLANVARADSVLAPLLDAAGQASRWFRPPLLHAGPDLEKKTALEHWLASHGYRIGFVTIDNQEWVFAAAYQRARTLSDAATMDRLVGAYVEHLLESATYYRDLSRQVFGREIPQVLLLHANRLNGDHLDRVLTALERTGAGFISMSEAVHDSAYASNDHYTGPRGLSWLQRWALARGVTPGPEPREPAWVRTAPDSTSVFR